MTTLQLPAFLPRPALLSRLRVLMILGAVGTVIGLLVSPRLTLGGLLQASCFTLGLGLSAMFIISLDYVTKAGWGAALRRIPESMIATLPVSCLAVMLVLAAGLTRLYPWAHADAGSHGHVDASLALWRTPWFFLARAAGCMILWLLFAFALLRNSRRQDQDGDLRRTHRNVGLSAAFLVVFAITLSLASFDWLMSLQAHWFSTMFGVYRFSGLFEVGLAAVTVIAILLRRVGYLREIVRPAHLHDLGKYLFCFATFWGYIWFCQYMLIWYSNIPEEATYFLLRHSGNWAPVAIVIVALNWAIPFFALLSANAKRNEQHLFRVAVLVLIGHWLDVYGMAIPPLAGDSGPANLWPVIPSLLVVPIFILGILRTLRATSLIPVRDPMLIESLHHH